MLSTWKFVAVLAAVVVCCERALGHGRLLEPPGRSSMWRAGFSTPHNYDDNALYCGGIANQYQQQGGRCGVCGDPYQGPRENEAGGKYATGTIGKTYRQGQVLTATVDVTANHLGYFTFKLCPNNNPNKRVTQSCLDRTVLQLADGSGSQYHVGTRKGRVQVALRLPQGLACSQCVLQWRYHTGNSFGTDASGRSCIGCGDQEEFYACADIAILASGGSGSAPQQTSSYGSQGHSWGSQAIHTGQSPPQQGSGHGVVLPVPHAATGAGAASQGHSWGGQAWQGHSSGGQAGHSGQSYGQSAPQQGSGFGALPNPWGPRPSIGGVAAASQTHVGVVQTGLGYLGAAQPQQGHYGTGQGYSATGQQQGFAGVFGSLRCVAIAKAWRGRPELDAWCRVTCLQANHCPKDFCACF